METIIICDSCNKKHARLIPLIHTLVFPKGDQWCPFCGETYDFFGEQFIESSLDLTAKKRKYHAYSEDYLSAIALFSCESIEINGQTVLRKDIPDEMLNKARKIINGYQFNHVIK